MDEARLTLPEQILLLALTDRDGSLLDETRFEVALGGALLAELLFDEFAEFDSGSGGFLVSPVRRKRTGDPALDQALVELHTAPRRASPRRWIERFAENRELHLEVARQLCRKGALDEHQGRVRLVFRRTVYVDVDPDARERLLGRIRGAVLDRAPGDLRTAVLAALAGAGVLLEAVLGEDEMNGHGEGLIALVEEAEVDDTRRGLRDRLLAVVRATHETMGDPAAAA
ncbi:MAG: GPP34 family phosphoprotein [Longimicrobiales bacterium]